MGTCWRLGCDFDRRFGGLRLGIALLAGDAGDVDGELVVRCLDAADRETSFGFVQQPGAEFGGVAPMQVSRRTVRRFHVLSSASSGYVQCIWEDVKLRIAK